MKTPAMRTSGCIGEIQDCIISCLNVVSNSTVACMRTFVAPIARHTHALNYHEFTPGQLAEKAMVGGVTKTRVQIGERLRLNLSKGMTFFASPSGLFGIIACGCSVAPVQGAIFLHVVD